LFACHGDQVLSLSRRPSDRERDIFASFTTTTNVAWLHTDASVLPSQPRARASWNYRLAADADLGAKRHLRRESSPAADDIGTVLRDAEPQRRDR